ncbi:MAG: hypothetical protein QE570_18040 [Verrucomicrobiota bacterium]|jgi:hypothetical protein|nr:hypothetical protein [Verrucomicrobiaceae bacterium]MDH4455078.1 hypothetical protein [Verrucomicrobiota bacterium]
MLSSRSARLAACLLLALLLGWVVRAQRKQSAPLTAPVTTPVPASPLEEPTKNTFPDE